MDGDPPHGTPDFCDACPLDDPNDSDGDGVCDTDDICDGGDDTADGDADGMPDFCDTCPAHPNEGGGPAVFDQPIRAASRTVFGWSTPRSVQWVRGDLAAVQGYGFDLTQTEPETTSFEDLALPGPGAGTWYAVKPDCPLGSWQTVPEGQPGRDEALP